ncbi:MAG: hypothetical protein FWD58_08560 [Firmicutes bacterium]|nr:hypothetical protein [Bacillota bacterium]
MRKHYNDENNPYNDADEDDEDEFAGYAITDEDGREVEREDKKKKKSYDDTPEEPVEASPIPKDEQTVMIDNARVASLGKGDALTLKITGAESAEVHGGSEKAGDLKPAYVKKLLETREGWYARCFLHSASFPVMVKIKFFERPHKGAVKVEVDG